jgi:hypothetical protein
MSIHRRKGQRHNTSSDSFTWSTVYASSALKYDLKTMYSSFRMLLCQNSDIPEPIQYITQKHLPLELAIISIIAEQRVDLGAEMQILAHSPTFFRESRLSLLQDTMTCTRRGAFSQQCGVDMKGYPRLKKSKTSQSQSIRL